MRNLTKGLAALGVGAALVAMLPMLSLADTLSTPTNLTPANGSTLTSEQWTSAQWNVVTGSSTPITYQYESSNSSTTNADGSFISPIYQSGILSSPSIGTNGTAPGTYWWHVRAVDNMGSTSPWSSAAMVTITSSSTDTSTGTTTAPAPLSAPTNLTPANGTSQTTTGLGSATWSVVAGSSTPITYLYESSASSSTNADGSFATPTYQSGPLNSPSISLSGTSAGTYWWHVRAVDSMGSTSSWSMPFMLTVTNATSTGTTTGGNTQDLINALNGLIGQFPSYTSQLQALITQLQGSGTTTTTGGALIDNPNRDATIGGAVDWVGRNFGHEETVTIMRNGTVVGTAHADGGGNFSTGSMAVPNAVGVYTYTFIGATSGMTATATLTVQ